MIPEPLDDVYFQWLYGHVAQTRYKSPQRNYWNLMRKLYTTEFKWFVANDDNRIADGVALRFEFMETASVDPDSEWLNAPCSVLEMLVAFTRRLSFEAEGEPRTWFWHILKNLRLDQLNDAQPLPESQVDNILHRMIYRQYKPNGRGGLFPLQKPYQDQREIELWYQMAAYILE